jgi:hypothetical protein
MLYTVDTKNSLHFTFCDTLGIIFRNFGHKLGYMKRLCPIFEIEAEAF